MSKEQIEVITYEQDRLYFFVDQVSLAQKKYDRLFKTFKDAPYLSEGAQFLSDAGRELQFYKDVVDMLDKGYRKQSEECEKRIANQREELRRLNKRINELTQSRDAWKKKAERVGKQLHEVLSKQSEDTVKHGTWYHGVENGAVYAKCSACGRKMNYSCYGYAYCALCGARMDGAKMKGDAE